MALPFFKWSRTKADNATADSGVNWQEGQAPSTVNDSARAMMASTAAFRDDISRGTITGGTGSAYTLSTFQVFDTLANMDRAMVTFVPLTTNTGACTLNVDGLGAKPLRSGNLVELPAGTLIGGSPYSATYFHSNGEWYLHAYFGNPQSDIPIGACVPYFGATAPNSNFAIPVGQAVSRTDFPVLFTLIGTTHGAGDGSATFNLPDMSGRGFYGKEATATRLTTAGGGLDGGTLGAVGGSQGGLLATNQIPSLTSSNGSVSLNASVTSTNWVAQNSGDSTPQAVAAGSQGYALTVNGGPSVAKIPSTGTATGSVSVTYTNSSQAVTKTVSPGIVGNWLMRLR